MSQISTIIVDGKSYILPKVENQYFKELATLKTPATGDWYIYFNIWDFDLGKWSPQKFYSKFLNNKEALAMKPKDRLYKATVILNECNSQLKAGINPKTAKSIAKFDNRTLLDALEDSKDDSPIPRLEEAIKKFLAVKSGEEGKAEAAENKENTASTYKSCFAQFKRYCIDKKIENQRVDKFSKLQVETFLDEFFLADIWGETSYNNNLGYIQSFFSYFSKKYDYPSYIKNIPKKEVTEESGRFDPFTLEQVKSIFTFLENTHTVIYPHYVRTMPANPFLSLVAKTIFYAFLRSSEIRRIKIKHVKRYKQNKFDLSIDITKNKKKSNNELYIDDALVTEFSKIGWEKYFDNPKYDNYYVFTPDLIPSLTKTPNYNFSKRFSTVLEKMQKDELIKLDKNYSLYSMKHTGNIEAFKAGYTLTQLQLQNRHASQQQTETYLRALKLEINEAPRPKRESL